MLFPCPHNAANRVIAAAPEFLYVPADRVLPEAERHGATPYGIPDAALGHHGPCCSFDAVMETYGSQESDPALDRLSRIVRGVDTVDKDLTPESRGLDAVARGGSG